jgi:hypothetical protein
MVVVRMRALHHSGRNWDGLVGAGALLKATHRAHGLRLGLFDGARWRWGYVNATVSRADCSLSHRRHGADSFTLIAPQAVRRHHA